MRLSLTMVIGLLATGTRAETAERVLRSVSVDSAGKGKWDVTRGETHHFTEFAQVEFAHRLSSSELPLTLPGGSREVRLRMVVTDQKGRSREKVVKCLARELAETPLLNNPSKNPTWSITFDSNVLHQFDTLPQGKSTVDFFLQGDGIRVGGDRPADEWLAGPRVELLLESFEAKKVPPTPEEDVRCVIRGFERRKHHLFDNVSKEVTVPLIDIVNDSDRDIAIGGYVNHEAPGEILQHSVAVETLRPGVGWQKPPVMGICGTGWGELTIAPDKKQPIDSLGINGRGVYRFAIPYTTTMKGKRRSGVARSQPFVQTREGARTLDAPAE